jgi:AraC-like DNA-binding protein
VLFLPHGGRHAIASDPAAPLADVIQSPSGQWTIAEEPSPSTGVTTSMLCGSYMLSRARAHPLMTGLPDVIHLPARVDDRVALRDAVSLLGRELEHRNPGVDALVPALLESLLVYILRAWFHDNAALATSGWAAALADPVLADALEAMHDGSPVDRGGAERPGRRLASRVRAPVHAVVGRTPLAYLTWWRMTISSRLLTSSDAPLRRIAERSGYSSEFAFAEAFKREFQVSPGRLPPTTSTSAGHRLKEFSYRLAVLNQAPAWSR